jgi:hypothetical protein
MLSRFSQFCGTGYNWNLLRITKSKYFNEPLEVSFQLSKDFDTADEPSVDETVSVSNDSKIRITKTPHLIFHHKWQWVEPDYKGFDFHKSKARSELWKPFVNSKELCKIGVKTYWDSIRPRWEKI